MVTLIEQQTFPAGGITPVFNEVSILLALSPTRPDPDAGLEDIDGFAERVLMQAPKNEATGIVEPTIFYRSDTYDDPVTGLRTQTLMLLADPPETYSKIFGGQLGMNVRPPSDVQAALAGASPEVVEANGSKVGPRHPFAAMPTQYSIGKIQALQPDSDFPARVFMPVYYAFVSGGTDGNLRNHSTNFSVQAREPHSMEAVVNSVPPDPNTPVRAKEWNLVDESTYLKLWIKVEAFRFLAIGDWEHKERLTFRDGEVVPENGRRADRPDTEPEPLDPPKR